MINPSILPNSFQTPNDYIDRAMELLTGEEFKCLMFAIRHIFGWKDKIVENKRKISISMFQNGFSTDAGRRFSGTGLSRKAIITATDSLDKFKFLSKGEITKEGQEYSIEAEPDWDKLLERQTEKLSRNRNRTQVARTVKTDEVVSGTNQQQVVSGTNQQRSVGLTSSGQSDLLNQTNYQTQDKEKDSAPQKGAGGDTPILTRVRNPMFDAVAVHIFKTSDPNAKGGRIGRISTWLEGKNEGREKLGFISKKADPDHVRLFAEWCKNKGIDPPLDLTKFVEHWRAWAIQANQSHRFQVDKTLVPDDWGLESFLRKPISVGAGGGK